MREFFHGWRRKVAVGALGLACAAILFDTVFPSSPDALARAKGFKTHGLLTVSGFVVAVFAAYALFWSRRKPKT